MVRGQFIKMSAPSTKTRDVMSSCVMNKRGDPAYPYNNDVPFIRGQSPTARETPGKNLSSTGNKQDARTFSPIKSSNNMVRERYLTSGSSCFLDIDGNDPIAVDQPPVEFDQKDTSHKIQRHLSLYDLSQPKSAKINNSLVHSKYDQSEGVRVSMKNAVVATSSANQKEPFQMPKGFSKADQPYVLPKFMPSFKEMMIGTKKEDPMISITESTPPSLQKWAVEWNSEPKSLSVSELKEDILREAEENDSRFLKEDLLDQPRSSPNVGLFSAGVGKTAQHAAVHNPMNPVRGVVFSQPQYRENKEHTPLDWLPDKYDRLKNIAEGRISEKYSFVEAIRGKCSNPDSKKPSGTIPQIYQQQSHVYDEEEQEFYEWFKQKMAKASEASLSGKIGSQNREQVHGDGGILNETSIEPTRNPAVIHTLSTTLASAEEGKTVDTKYEETIPEKQLQNSAVRQKFSNYERNSSFYQWLNSRGFTFENCTSSLGKRPKSAATVEEKVGKAELPVYPWSSSYIQKYTPKGNVSIQGLDLRVDKAEALSNVSNSRTVSLHRKVKSQMSLRKPKLTRKTKSLDVIHRQNAGGRNSHSDQDSKMNRRDGFTKKSAPYCRWVVNSEIDHVQNLRRLDLKPFSFKSVHPGNHPIALQYENLSKFKSSDGPKENKPAGLPHFGAEKENVVHRLASKFPKPCISSLLDHESLAENSSTNVTDCNGFTSIAEDNVPLTHIDITVLNDEQNQNSFEFATNSCSPEIGVDSSNPLSRTNNSLWSITSQQPTKTDDCPDESAHMVGHPDFTDFEIYEAAKNGKLENDLLLDEAETDEDWIETQGSKNLWSDDKDLFKLMAGQSTGVESFSSPSQL